MSCYICGTKVIKDDEYYEGDVLCDKMECYDEDVCRQYYKELKAVVSDCVGKKLIAFELSGDGGKAILQFENKTIVLGASGNLHDEAFPCFQDNDVARFPVWKQKVTIKWKK